MKTAADGKVSFFNHSRTVLGKDSAENSFPSIRIIISQKLIELLDNVSGGGGPQMFDIDRFEIVGR